MNPRHWPPARHYDIPPALSAALRRAHIIETAASGPSRRAAFRVTRELIGAAVETGYSIPAIARCLAVKTETVRARIANDGWLSADTVALLADVSSATVQRWHDTGLLPRQRLGPDGQACYAAVDLVRVLAATQRPPD